jgi:hypothetical protein
MFERQRLHLFALAALLVGMNALLTRDVLAGEL